MKSFQLCILAATALFVQGEEVVSLRKLTSQQMIGKSPAGVDSEHQWAKFKQSLIELKQDLPGFKKSGALSYRCKSAQCELCFTGTAHKVCSEVSYGLSSQKGVFSILVGLDDSGLILPAITGEMKSGTVVCSKIKMLSEICMRIKSVRTGTMNESGTASICFELQIAGANIFHACVEGTKSSLQVSKA